ncbi:MULTISPECIES: peptidoglycan-associated lipoprotein Pal [Azospirillum]|uniref:Peptidoglycan-associated lipoprotein n=2 Tax=Azospirillum TaxID=191 RepID=A0A6L3B6P9_AZOBR|nr:MULTISPECIES: peptidoglycan-associated lipoprotein Pal [Azospirillum]KAA0688715.1 peptidoglycan-associated lipoprotein Pal [Azospirillum brasilense]MBK3732961.1 peptidoglycan-associated lipoprotein Pal [Azospirillum brasilense]MBY3753356.1 peptidoglycan-associated lipoprotein Pal [Azospirillum formosense]NUB20808.1 peptidoglycan-associated lipoprotein Pal [Azospirillum formosense]UKJ72394.1 peptidoglycan-associated lipoprotein Pal [Azospirillum brasilense]
MRIKYLSLIAAVALVAACETAPKDAGNANATGAATSSQIRPGSQEDLVVNVGDRVFFGLDRYDLAPEARATLDRQASWLKQYPNVTVTVEGHADERGTREYNLALGERRANSVKNYLVAGGINASRVKVISYGKEKPAVLGSNEASWAQNRRGVTVVD